MGYEGGGDDEQHSSRGISRRPLIAIFVFLTTSYLVARVPSFATPVVLAKLAIALIHLAGIGLAAHILLNLQRPRHLPGAGYALVGQVIALAYVYLRSLISELTGLPGISLLEVHLVEALLAAWVVMRLGATRWRSSATTTEVGAEAALCFLWLSWLFWIASQKLVLHYTPSSDPDIHAFYARILLERGHFFYDLEPISDAWMIYPSGFSALSLALARVSGFHAVQLVNVIVYLQVTLFAGAAFCLIAQGLRRSRSAIALGVVFFGVTYLCLNPGLLPGRSHLEGTPRLAHIALLFFPLFFNLINASRITRTPGLLMLPAIAVLVGMCINPTHAPASLLMGALSLLPLVSTASRRRRLVRRRAGSWSMIAASLVALSLLVLAADPFYRSLAQQQLGLWQELEAAEELTGSAFTPRIDPLELASRVTRSGAHWLLPPEESGAAAPAFATAIAALLVVLLIASRFARKPSWRRFALGNRNLGLFALCGFLFLFIHAIWSEAAAIIARPGVLQGVLLIRYTHAMQYQAAIAFYAIASGVPIALGLAAIENRKRSHDARASRQIAVVAALLGLGLVVALPSLISLSRESWREFRPKLTESPLGRVDAADVAFLREIESLIPQDERVLLPGRLRRTGIEDWFLTTGIGRAVPLFTDIKTSFYLGLDGRAFTPGAYRRHVKEGVDREWLHSLRVIWLIENGNFHPGVLKRHWRLVTGSDRGNLWRLRDPEEPIGVPGAAP